MAKGIEGLPPEGPGPEGTHRGRGSMAESLLTGTYDRIPNTVPLDLNHQTPLQTGVPMTQRAADDMMEEDL